MKIKLQTILFLLVFGISSLNAQTKIPDSYYSIKHFKTTMPMEGYFYWGSQNPTNIPQHLIDTSGQTDVSDVIQFYIDSLYQNKGSQVKEVILPSGHFLIEKPIRIRDSIFLKGTSSEETIINCQVGEGNACFEIKPDDINPIQILPIRTSVLKGTNELVFHKDTLDHYLGSDFAFGYMAMVSGKDSDRISMPWANGMVKEFFKGHVDMLVGQPNNRVVYFNIADIVFYDNGLFYGMFKKKNKFGIQNELCLNYSIEYEPRIEVYKMIKDAGLGCVTINRTENVSGETPNILLQNATDCVVKAIVSIYCNQTHISVKNSFHNVFKRNYLSFANDYSAADKGIGFNVQMGSSHNCFFDNVMFQLRHSIVVQSGANNNVFISNYSYDPVRSDVPDEVWGDIVLKGNYPFANLFESNMAEEFVFDNSNGKNGPFNIVHRNMFGGHGIIMKEQNGSDSQVFTGNEIPNETLGKFLLEDSGHFVFGNKHHQTIIPEGTNLTLEGYVINRNYYCFNYLPRRTSVPYYACPYDIMDSNYNHIQYPPFGFPFNQSLRNILAMRKKDIEPSCFDTLCDQIHYTGIVNQVSKPMLSLVVYPNPSDGNFKINLTGKLSVFDLSGRQIAEFEVTDENQVFSLLHSGLFILKLTQSDGIYTCRLVVY